MQRSIIIGRPTITFDTIDSTNDYAISLVSNSNPNEGTVIWAQYQSKGRGQIGSNWSADPGVSLLMSVILKPRFLMAYQQFTLNILVSLAIRSALASYDIDTHIKWPNDIYIDRKKICGILIQNVLQGKGIKNAILGIGLNVNQDHFDLPLPNPTSMRMVSGTVFDIADVKSTVCIHLQEYYHRLMEDGFELLKEEYLELLYLKDEISEYEIDEEVVKGKILGITDIGKLQLEMDGEVRKFNFRELKYLHK